jgi:hypothetical protein
MYLAMVKMARWTTMATVTHLIMALAFHVLFAMGATGQGKNIYL